MRDSIVYDSNYFRYSAVEVNFSLEILTNVKKCGNFPSHTLENWKQCIVNLHIPHSHNKIFIIVLKNNIKQKQDCSYQSEALKVPTAF